MLMEKQDMQHLKLKMLLLKEITINNSHFLFQENKWLSSLISFWNPLFT
jgi:hypothetical protein